MRKTIVHMTWYRRVTAALYALMFITTAVAIGHLYLSA
jgi:hypothetical protein